MSDYSFEYESLNDKIRDLECEIERLRSELIETDNTLYEIMSRLDNLEGASYNTPIVP